MTISIERQVTKDEIWALQAVSIIIQQHSIEDKCRKIEMLEKKHYNVKLHEKVKKAAVIYKHYTLGQLVGKIKFKASNVKAVKKTKSQILERENISTFHR